MPPSPPPPLLLLPLFPPLAALEKLSSTPLGLGLRRARLAARPPPKPPGVPASDSELRTARSMAASSVSDVAKSSSSRREMIPPAPPPEPDLLLPDGVEAAAAAAPAVLLPPTPSSSSSSSPWRRLLGMPPADPLRPDMAAGLLGYEGVGVAAVGARNTARGNNSST